MFGLMVMVTLRVRFMFSFVNIVLIFELRGSPMQYGGNSYTSKPHPYCCPFES